MTHILHRQIHATLPVASGGKGIELFDTDGRAYIDASGGAAVSCLGHGHPDILAAMHRQADTLAYAHTSFFTSEAAEALADRLVSNAPAGISHAYFVSGGSEAVEAALKMARQYFVETVSRSGATSSRAGRAITATRSVRWRPGAMNGGARSSGRCLSTRTTSIPASPIASSKPARPMKTMPAAPHRRWKTRSSGSARNGDGIRCRNCRRCDRGRGAAGGRLLPSGPRHLRPPRVLLILDEVMCGMGRTGTLHACEQEGIAPDLMTIAKGLGGGYQPIGAVLLSQKIFDAFSSGSGLFQHGHTYVCHPMACAAALAVQEVITRDKLLDNGRAMGTHLSRRLGERFGNHPHVGDIRGRGLFMGVELVEDRSTKAPFDPKRKLHARIKKQAMARGLLVYPMGGTIDGINGDHVLLAPPFICDVPAIDAIVERLGDAIEAALRTSPN